MVVNNSQLGSGYPPSKRGYRKYFFYFFIGPVGYIIWWKIVKSARSDLKMFQNCKISSFLGLKIRRFFFGGVDDDYDDFHNQKYDIDST